MTPEVKEQLVRHQKWLLKDLEDPRRDLDDNYVRMATHLRTLLADADFPILLRCVEETGIVLYVWGPRASGDELSSTTILQYSAHKAVWMPMPEHGPFLRPFTIHGYLDCCLGIASLGGPSQYQTHKYTPRQLIKWTANKDGGAHFDTKKPATLRAVRGMAATVDGVTLENYEVREFIRQMSVWAVSGIECLLRETPN